MNKEYKPMEKDEFFFSLKIFGIRIEIGKRVKEEEKEPKIIATFNTDFINNALDWLSNLFLDKVNKMADEHEEKKQQEKEENAEAVEDHVSEETCVDSNTEDEDLEMYA